MNIGSPSSSEQKRSTVRKSVKKMSMSKNKTVQRHKERKGQDVDLTVEDLGREVQELIPQLQQLRMKYNELVMQNLYLRRLPVDPAVTAMMPSVQNTEAAAKSALPVGVPMMVPVADPSSSESGHTAQEELIINMPGDDIDFSDLLDEDDLAPTGPQEAQHGPFASPSAHCKVEAVFSQSTPSDYPTKFHTAPTNRACTPKLTQHLRSLSAQLPPSHSAPVMPHCSQLAPYHLKQDPASAALSSSLLSVTQQYKPTALPMLNTPNAYSSGMAAQAHRCSMGPHMHAEYRLGHAMLPASAAASASLMHPELLQDGDNDAMAIDYLSQMVFESSNSHSAGAQHAPSRSPGTPAMRCTARPSSAQHTGPALVQHASMPTLPSNGLIQSLQLQMASKSQQHSCSIMKQEPVLCGLEPSMHCQQPVQQHDPHRCDQGLPLLDPWVTGPYDNCSKDAFDFNPFNPFDEDMCFIDADDM